MPTDKARELLFPSGESHAEIFLDAEEKIPVCVGVTFWPEYGLRIHICADHDWEGLFEDRNAYRLDLIEALNCALTFTAVSKSERILNTRLMAEYLRYVANLLDIDAAHSEKNDKPFEIKK